MDYLLRRQGPHEPWDTIDTYSHLDDAKLTLSRIVENRAQGRVNRSGLSGSYFSEIEDAVIKLKIERRGR